MSDTMLVAVGVAFLMCAVWCVWRIVTMPDNE